MPCRKPYPALIAAAALGLAGCSAGSAGRFAARPDSAVAPRPTLAVADVVRRTNANAEKVETLRADSAVAGTFSRIGAALDGYIALERPRNFKMKLSRGMMGSEVLDLGSNDREFWLWSREDKDKAIYVGEFDSTGSIPPEVGFQPDWIIEALGLREIPASEAASLQVERGRDPDTWVLTHLRPDGHGGTQRKQTVISQRTHRPIQHIYYANDQRTVVAVVEPMDLRAYPVPDSGGYEDDYEDSESQATTAIVELPQRIMVRLNPQAAESRDRLNADIRLSKVEVNPSFSADNRDAFFTVPLAQHPDAEQRPFFDTPAYASGAEVRTSLPAPSSASPSGAELGAPEPIGVEDSALLRDDPMPLEADLSAASGAYAPEPVTAPGAIGGVVREGFPTAPGRSNDYDRPATRVVRGGILGTGFDR